MFDRLQTHFSIIYRTLKKLEICVSVRTFKSISFWIGNEILIFERISLTKIKCQSNRTTLVFFEQFRLLMSVIKRFSLHIYIDIQDEILLERLINDWWSFIQQIEKINIWIRISKQISQADDQIQKKFANSMTSSYEKFLYTLDILKRLIG